MPALASGRGRYSDSTPALLLASLWLYTGCIPARLEAGSPFTMAHVVFAAAWSLQRRFTL